MVKGPLIDQIPDYDYLICEDGTVYNLSRYLSDGMYLTTFLGLGDYPAVKLSKGSVVYSHYVHRLVADTFIPREEGKEFINHKDGNKLNPHRCNLERTTHSENILHAYRMGLMKKDSISKRVINIESNEIYPSAKEVAERFNINYPTLKNYLNGNRNNPTAFRYIDEVA